MALTAGTKLGPYEIQSPLGVGGMGEVYRARDSRLNRDVAIKILPAAFSRDPERLQRFAQESRAAAALNHPNILSIYDIGEAQGSPYIVSELLVGETLRDRVRTGSLSSRKAVDFAHQICKGLAAAHEKGIVHRDLKPENLFIANDGRIKILDFGLAKLTHPEADLLGDAPTQQVNTETGAIMGTVGYMSPEQVRGRPTDARSDIFSLGAILYEMLSGKRAFRGESSADTMSAILKEDPPDLAETNRNVSPALERIVRHCLEKNPGERFQSAHDVAFNLEALSDISSTSRGGVHALPEQKSHVRWALPLAAGLLVLLSCILVYRFARRAVVTSPVFHEVTFRSGAIWDARFAADGQTIVYGAAWDGSPQEIYTTRYDSTDSRPLGIRPAQILSLSSKGELAVALNPVDSGPFVQTGTLARAPLAGGAPREMMEGVFWADWTPDGESLAVIRFSSVSLAHLEFPVGNVIYEPRGWVSHVRFSPNGQYLAIGDHIVGGDDGRVVVIDTHGNRKAASSFYSSVEGLAWAPDGKEVWFTASPVGSQHAVYAMDLSGAERLIYSAPGGVTIRDISRTGLVLLTADKSRVTLYALPPGETQERNLSWFDWTLLADMSSDSKTVLFSETGQASGGEYNLYLRKTDGSPALKLGQGGFGKLSPDGQWVAAEVGSPPKLMLLPTGAGEPRLLLGDKGDRFGCRWLPDGKALVYYSTDPGHGPRPYLLELKGGQPRPFAPENTGDGIVSPDGKFFLATDRQRQAWLYPIDGGEPRKLAFSLAPGERLNRFLDGGKTVLIRTRSVPVQLTRVDLATGQRNLWKQLTPSDPAGVLGVPSMLFSADGKSYAYSVGRVLSDLYVVDGLK
ncbi:MAG TPA: protein kinase [Candidatus Solibacter sp.]|nr:protein kinase [Candidatus Solibacter sp.]